MILNFRDACKANWSLTKFYKKFSKQDKKRITHLSRSNGFSNYVQILQYEWAIIWELRFELLRCLGNDDDNNIVDEDDDNDSNSNNNVFFLFLPKSQGHSDKNDTMALPMTTTTITMPMMMITGLWYRYNLTIQVVLLLLLMMMLLLMMLLLVVFFSFLSDLV